MDCEKFDRVLLDLLYGELDELTRAGASRHADQCRRCKLRWQGLKATREVGALPLDEPRENFETRVVERERQARVGLPLAVRMSRNLTIVAGQAMRHELAMAALALLMIGSSLLLLRPRPGPHASSAVAQQEGVPLPEPEEVVVPVQEPPEEPVEVAEEAPAEQPAPAASSPAKKKAEPAAAVASNTGPSSEEELDLARARAEDRAYAAAMNSFRGADYAGAEQQFDAIVQSGGHNAAASELYAAIAAEQAQGCAAAVPRFDSVSAKYPSSDLGHQATWHSAVCRTQLGHDRRALLDFQRLLKVPAYAARARKALGLVGTESAQNVTDEQGLSSAELAPVSSEQAAANGQSPPAASSGSTPTESTPALPAPGASSNPERQDGSKPGPSSSANSGTGNSAAASPGAGG
ncbi:MAG TPA: hypothetical protein VHM70_09375 [Polyangiaceae bacterium]|jgi:hypothetical protein|nr:hypothetical protein [Polyangiaceae bacterium]